MKLHEITGSNFPTTREEVITRLKQYNIRNFTINPDLTVDVQNILLRNQKFTSFPVCFRNVNSDFNCDNCKLLTSLEGAPVFVDGDFYCTGCTSLTSLEDFNQDIQVACEFHCDWKNIKKGGLGLVGSGITKLYEPTGPFIIIQKYLGTDNIIECQSELIEAGFEEHAVL